MVDHGLNVVAEDGLPQTFLSDQNHSIAQKSHNELYTDASDTDVAVASSPVLKDIQSSPYQALERERNSQPLTDRLKRDLQDNRSTDSEPRDDDSIIRDDGDSAIGQVSDLDDANPDDLSGQRGGSPRTAEEIEAVKYSTLSKRADYILANAKKKLDLLEGNLGRARHSLLYSPTGTGDYRTSSSLSAYSPLQSPSEEDRRLRLGPRINFAPSRDSRGVARRATTGHNRMFSDTSVPSPRGAAIKGSRSLNYVRNDTEVERRRFQKSSSKGSNPDAPLEEAMEATEAPSQGSIEAIRKLYGVSPVPEAKSTKDLREQAEELRNRISFLQQHPPGSGSRRGSIMGNSSALEQEEEAFKSEVQALEQHLEHQEEVIDQLEDAERRGSIVQDPRAEWHQVLDYNERSDASDVSDDDYDDLDSVEYEDVLIAPEEDAEATDGAHEDRSDAFDYEHFILHSGMGSYNMMAPEDSSSGSVRSTSTTRGHPAEGLENDAWSRSVNGTGVEQGPSDSVNSLTSYETAAEPYDSENDSGNFTSSTGGANGTDKNVEDVWPMPPASRSASRRSKADKASIRDSSVQTPTQRDFPGLVEDKGVQLDLSQRPVSTIYAALMAGEEAAAITRSMSELEEKDLIRATVESLRRVCLTLRGSDSEVNEKSGLRERLEVARRVLDGEL